MATVGILGKKVGMTRIFLDSGVSVPVTVIEALPNVVTQVKSVDTDGYSAVQITTGEKKQKHLSKAELGHFAKANVTPGRLLAEFTVAADLLASFDIGSSITVEQFDEGQKVDVSGTSKGKGFQGCVKRHNFSTQDATHGNSLAHRAPGSTGQNQTPRKVFKGKKMAGQMGNERSTVQNLEVVRIDAEKHLLLIKGAVPGAPGGTVVVKAAVKSHTDAATAAA